jgi:prepilin-type processing-associated H-X9-DG protein
MARRRVQVLVLLGVGVLCAGLLVVAVQGVRRSAQEMECRQNLQALAKSLENYYWSYNRFPPGTIWNDDLPVERRLSWTVDAWSFYEAHMLRHARTKSWDAEENHLVAILTPRFLLCPANSEQKREGVGLAHYVGIAGVGADAARLPAGDRNAGVFGYDRATKREYIKDGLATTLMVLETTSALGPWCAGGPSTVRGLDPEGAPYLGAGGQFGSMHRHTLPGSLSGRVTTNALFADGSVRPLTPDVSPRVLEALATIAGGEEVAPP